MQKKGTYFYRIKKIADGTFSKNKKSYCKDNIYNRNASAPQQGSKGNRSIHLHEQNKFIF
jgi:hypothetical protein